MSEHYKYLKRNSYSPRVICFESKALHRVDIDPSDLLAVDGSNVVSTVWRLARVLSAIKPVQVFCHSGYIELGIAALLAGLEFSVFVHQPTTMSYNETDKYSFRFIGKYRRFAKKDRMYVELMQTHASLAWRQTLYYNARAVISQYVLRRASKLLGAVFCRTMPCAKSSRCSDSPHLGTPVRFHRGGSPRSTPRHRLHLSPAHLRSYRFHDWM